MAVEQKAGKSTNKTSSSDFRLLSLAIAGMISFVVGTSGGAAAWYWLGSNSPRNESEGNKNTNPFIVSSSQPNGNSGANTAATNQTVAATPAPTEAAKTEPSPQPGIVLAPAGELKVESTVIAIGGGATKRPVQRIAVKEFPIGETEVTVAQFREFLEATKDTNDLSKKIKLPADKDDHPVTGVTLSEAKQYCAWLGKKIGAEVRLPTEAEWELAARGKDGLKYPWGNEWNDEAAACKENKGTVQAVKSYSLNKSPFGAFDMAGNVWEWTADVAPAALGEEAAATAQTDTLRKTETLYIVKGGAAAEPKQNVSAQVWFKIPPTVRSEFVGFRYVVIR